MMTKDQADAAREILTRELERGGDLDSYERALKEELGIERNELVMQRIKYLIAESQGFFDDLKPAAAAAR